MAGGRRGGRGSPSRRGGGGVGGADSERGGSPLCTSLLHPLARLKGQQRSPLPLPFSTLPLPPRRAGPGPPAAPPSPCPPPARPAPLPGHTHGRAGPAPRSSLPVPPPAFPATAPAPSVSAATAPALPARPPAPTPARALPLLLAPAGSPPPQPCSRPAGCRNAGTCSLPVFLPSLLLLSPAEGNAVRLPHRAFILPRKNCSLGFALVISESLSVLQDS